jgi:MFS family permease
MAVRLSGLWRHPDFLRFWTGQTISVFGSMIGGTALSFTAILYLDATPFQISLLNAMQIAPAMAAGLFAGAWVDRLRRRPLMIAADLGRSLALASIPLAALVTMLRVEHVILVALATSILGILFDLAYQSYLPGLVGREQVIEGNSKLGASAAAAEFAGFSIGGWLVQALGPPMAVLLDAASFAISALSLGLIRTHEAALQPTGNPDMRHEIADGLNTVLHHRLLRPLAAAVLLENLTGSMYGALVVLYMSRGLGFTPGVLGMIWAVGGISSLVAAALAPRITRRVGVGRVMAGGLVVFGISMGLIPLASGATLLSAGLLILQQLGDGFYVMYQINDVSLRQRITDERILGRVNATMRFTGLAASLVGTLLGGTLGTLVGIRPVLFAGALGTIAAGVMLGLSSVNGEEPVNSKP